MTASARFIGLGLALSLFLVAACAPFVTPKPPEAKPTVKLSLAHASFADLDGWADDQHGAALGTFLNSCAWIEKLPDERPMGGAVVGDAAGGGGYAGTAADWKPVCAEARGIAPKDDGAARRFFEARFEPYEVRADGKPEGLFTGYYEPELRAALKKDARFRVPLHGRPHDLITVDLGQFRDAWKGERIAGRVDNDRLVPYEARAEIEQGALDGRAPVLAWVDNPVDAFFLQIQGSGRLALKDGSMRRIGYEVANGQPYVAVSKVLLDDGALEKGKVSMQTIRAWLAKHPVEAPAVMNRNPSYVFFRWQDGLAASDGPIGAQGVPLTAGRSLAVDRKLIPFGAPLWLETTSLEAPDGKFRRLMVAQDTGGAIVGPVRGDIFFGTGDKAGEHAGVMNVSGRYFVLLPKGVAATVAAE